MLARKYIPTRLLPDPPPAPVNISVVQKAALLRPVILLLLFAKMAWTFFWRRQLPCCADLGIVWTRLAQMLALRVDLFSAAFCRALAKLVDRSDGIAFADVRRVLERDLHVDLDQLFADFDPIPFAVTSIAQSHRAWLRKEQVWVNVKVQKTHVASFVAQDQALLGRIVGFFRWLSLYRNVHWDELRKQLEDQLYKELDFRFEASALRRFKKNLWRHGIYAPDIFVAYCTRHVLVTEHLDAACMADVMAYRQHDPQCFDAWLQENRIDLRRVAQRLFSSVYRQMLEDNCLHGDLQPNNILLLRKNRLAITGCCTAWSLDQETLTRYRLFLQALVMQRYSTAVDYYFMLSSCLPAMGIVEVRVDCIKAVRIWETKVHIKTLPYADRSILNLLERLYALIFFDQSGVQWSSTKLTMAWTNLDTTLLLLQPTMNYRRYLCRYFKQADRRQAKPDPQQLQETMLRNLNATRKLPRQLFEYAFCQQSIIRHEALVLRSTCTLSASIGAAFFGWVSFVLLLSSVFLSITAASQSLGYPAENMVGVQIGIVLRACPNLPGGVWVAVLLLNLYCGWLAMKMKCYLAEGKVRLPFAAS